MRHAFNIYLIECAAITADRFE